MSKQRAGDATISIQSVELFISTMENYVDESILSCIETTLYKHSSSAMFRVSMDVHDLITYRDVRNINDDIMDELISNMSEKL